MMRVGIAADHGGFALKGSWRSCSVALGTRSWTSARMTTPTSSSLWPRPWPGGRLNAEWRYVAAAYPERPEITNQAHFKIRMWGTHESATRHLPWLA
jgi:hypothetical protein